MGKEHAVAVAVASASFSMSASLSPSMLFISFPLSPSLTLYLSLPTHPPSLPFLSHCLSASGSGCLDSQFTVLPGLRFRESLQTSSQKEKRRHLKIGIREHKNRTEADHSIVSHEERTINNNESKLGHEYFTKNITLRNV